MSLASISIWFSWKGLLDTKEKSITTRKYFKTNLILLLSVYFLSYLESEQIIWHRDWYIHDIHKFIRNLKSFESFLVPCIHSSLCWNMFCIISIHVFIVTNSFCSHVILLFFCCCLSRFHKAANIETCACFTVRNNSN